MLPLYRMLRQGALQCLALGQLLAVTAACGTSEPAASTTSPSRLAVPTPTPHIQRLSNITWSVAPSLEEQIFTSAVIVRASLQSATAVVETVSGDPGVAATYRPVQELRFTAHEYLKGSGPTTLLVVVRGGHTYVTETQARSAASRAVRERVTTWDDRQGVLFLDTPEPPYTPPAANDKAAGAASTTALEFTQSNYDQSPWAYSVDALSRAWLPARDAGGAGGASGTSDPVFITDGAQSPPPVVSLTDLRAKIAAMAAEIRAGEGIQGFAECLRGKIIRERINRADPWSPLQFEVSLPSGAPAAAEVYKATKKQQEPKYNRYWLSGLDAERFQTRIIDDDDQSSTGYDHALATARPLPAGAYQVRYNSQHHTRFPCNYVPDDAYTAFTVTVTAPAGTVHEAFFDPVAIGRGVGADGSNGALEPTAFTVGETAVSLLRLTWEDRQLQLELSAAVTLADHYLDVIALDGSVVLRLSLDDATTAATDGGQAWRWPSCASPWAAGDQLMLRLHHSATELADVTTHPGCGPAPTFGAASYAFSVAEDAAAAAAVGTVSATGTGDEPVSFAITAGNDAGAFAIDASTGALTVAGALDYETTTSYSLTVQAVQATSLAATVSVAVTITDAAEPPTFGESSYAFSVAEDAAVAAAVGTVTATARANGAVSYALTAGNDDGAFAINASTGAITVAGALDYETTMSYTLTVTANHGVSTTTVSVAVTVTDVDEPPTFGAASYAFSVAEDAAVAAAVGTVAATGTGDAAVSHSITAGNAGTAFAIDGTSGAVTVAGALDYETTTSYTLTVQAVQGASDPATVRVAITVTDVAEPPTFGAASYAFSVAEDAAAAAAVGTVSATGTGDEPVSFAITAGNDAGAFAINASTGAITVAGALDYETTMSYTLTVTASHGVSTTTVTVTVTVTEAE